MIAKVQYYVAVDLGAESGRLIVGIFDGAKLRLQEVHRFRTGPTYILHTMRWDILGFWREIEAGLSAVGVAYNSPTAIGIDTWGVDFGLLDREDELIGNPYHYRDRRSSAVVDKVSQLVSRREIFEHTGIQFMPVNTLYQLYSMVHSGSAQLRHAETFLMIPDLLNFWLTGQKVCEFTNATTTQLHDPRGGWSKAIFEKLGLSLAIMPNVVPPGTVLGPLLKDVASRNGLDERVRVIAPACHDTGSAVVGTPGSGSNWAYLSSGTWSLLGVEVKTPILDEHAFRHNFTNEGGAAGTFRFLKNISGLWLLQECRRAWAAAGKEISYAELTELASRARPFVALIDPDDPVFLQPGDMPRRIESYLARRSKVAAVDPGATVRIILESLALKYRHVLELIEALSGRQISTIHIVGGGSENRLLNQFTADASGRVVFAGPSEATAVGNILMQAFACGEIGGLAEAREVVRRSFAIAMYEPKSRTGWDEAYGQFRQMFHDQELSH